MNATDATPGAAVTAAELAGLAELLRQKRFAEALQAGEALLARSPADRDLSLIHI